MFFPFEGNYISDFTFTATSVISIDGELVYEGATPEQCSLICVTADGFNCQSFDFCPKSKKCLLNSGYSNVITSKNTTTELCSNYKRNSKLFPNRFK